MSVTSAPIGSTAQSLDGFAVDANVLQAFRESVVITGPNSSSEIVTPVSTQPIGMYGVPVWMLGTPGVTVSGSTQVQVLGTVSTFPTGTTSVFVVSSVPHALAGTSQVFGQVSSFPIGVMSSFAVNQLTTTSVNVLNSIVLSGTSQVFGAVSTFPTGQSSTFVANGLNVTAAAWAAATTAVSPAQVVAVGAKVIVASLPSTTGAGNMQNDISDSAGRQIVHLYNSRELIGTQGTAMTSVASTSETTIVTASSATFRDLCELIITTNGTVAGAWRLRDATATTSPVYIFNTPAAQGSILNLLFQPPLKQGLVNNNWTLQSNNVSTQGNIVAIYSNTQ